MTDDVVKEGSDSVKSPSDLVNDNVKGKNDAVNDSVNKPEKPVIDGGINYSTKGYLDLEEAVVVRNVSHRTLTRDIDEFLKEIGLTWKCEPEKLAAKTKKLIKRSVKGILGNKKFKWDMSNLFLDDLDRKHRKEKVVLVKPYPDIVKPKSDVDKPQEKTWIGNIGEKIKTALKWQGLRHEGDIRELRATLKGKDERIVELKKDSKEKDNRISELTENLGKEKGRVGLLLGRVNQLEEQLQIGPPIIIPEEKPEEGEIKEEVAKGNENSNSTHKNGLEKKGDKNFQRRI